MRSHCALYVDAGYLLAATATRLTGTSLRRGIKVDHKQLIESLADHATTTSGLQLLRVHWYDAARNGVPDEVQQRIGLLPRVKVRLGRIGFDGEQKGVDLRIGLDMVAHARNAAVDVIVLVSGDDDLTEAVEEAQAHGVQVILLAVPSSEGDAHSVSRHLQRAADGLELLSADALDAAVVPNTDEARGTIAVQPATPSHPAPSPTLLAPKESSARSSKPLPSTQTAPNAPTTAPPSVLPSSGTGTGNAALVYSSSTGGSTKVATAYMGPEVVSAAMDQVVDRVLSTWLSGATASQRAELQASRPSIPREIDRALLLDLSSRLGIYDLTDTERHEVRARFWAKADRDGIA